MRWVSLGVLAAAAVVLAIFWGDVPDRWVIHWGPHDRPDGWAAKSAVSAAIPLVLGLFSWVAVEGIALWLGRAGAGRAGYPRKTMRVQATVARAVGLAIALLCAGLAVGLPLVRPRSSFPIGVATIAVIVLVVGTALKWAAAETERQRGSGVAVPEGYNGVFYKNPRDPRLWVPKIAGVGWTINFAHRLAWPAMIALCGVPLAVVLLVAFAGR